MKKEFIKRYWFLSSLLIILLVAFLKPNVGKNGGLLRPEWTIKYVSAFIIFFFTGYSIKAQVRRIIFTLIIFETKMKIVFLF